MLSKHLDHAAFGNPAMRTLRDHTLQFGFQFDEVADPPFDLTEPHTRNYIRGQA
jgi:hypothetical protein